MKKIKTHEEEWEAHNEDDKQPNLSEEKIRDYQHTGGEDEGCFPSNVKGWRLQAAQNRHAPPIYQEKSEYSDSNPTFQGTYVSPPGAQKAI